MALLDGRTRREQRAGLTDKQRINFLEDDVDRSDAKTAAAVAASNAGIKRIEALMFKLIFSVLGLALTIVGGIVVGVVTR